ncbi:MAG: hypothetical protein K0S39_287 [Paenibacillus sp.]|jgi:uncharacterized ferritin-like protein (DUF455 family)|nr:hypothetical protein [Paenibacillus sp.]
MDMAGLSFGGIGNPYALAAFGVDENAQLLMRYRYIHEQLVRTGAGKIPDLEVWEVKGALGKHLYEDAESAQALRLRILELRTTAGRLEQVPSPALKLLFEELLHAKTDMELLVAIYDLLKPMLLDAYRRHMQETHQIGDQPTIRMMRTLAADLEEQIAWGKRMLRHLCEENVYPPADEFRGMLEQIITAAGGLDGRAPKSTKIPDRFRSKEAYRMPKQTKRDPRRMGPTSWVRTAVQPEPEEPKLKKLYAMMRNRQEEMSAVEMLCLVLFHQQSMPWEFTLDAARHLWDEVRHSMLGQAALEREGLEWRSLPQYVGGYDPLVEKLPEQNYIHLTIGVEEQLMKRPGKVAEYEFCRDEAKHDYMTQVQDYDWADEVTHASFGRKWGPELLNEDISFVREAAHQEVQDRNRKFAAFKEKQEVNAGGAGSATGY